jgi:ammonium transporter, Amt family
MDGYHAWMLIASSLILLMAVPGLALFYGGMSRASSVMNIMMMTFAAVAIVSLVFALWGWSMAYSSVPSIAADPDNPGWSLFGLFANPLKQFALATTKPEDYIQVGFQITFAALTAALVSGAIADRTKFSAWIVFVPLWTTFCYIPIAHQVWGGGMLSDSADGLSAMLFGAADGLAKVVPVDYAGGVVVHINAGIAGLVLAWLVGARRSLGEVVHEPANLPFTLTGAALMWFGWLGFNAGSLRFTSSDEAARTTQFVAETGHVWLNTMLAAATGMLGWIAIEAFRHRKPTPLGAAMGVVSGLVAITPAAFSVSPFGAMILGLVGGLLCSVAVAMKNRLGYDDSLDVVGIHLAGGLWGTLSIGFFDSQNGMLYGHGLQLLLVQALIAIWAIVWTGLGTLVIGLIVKYTVGWRLPILHEIEGVDAIMHGESAFDPRHRRIRAS